MKTAKDNLTELKDFQYVPVYRYKGSRSNFVTQSYSVLVEAFMNALWKKITYKAVPDSQRVSNFLDQSVADSMHLGIISEEEHDELIRISEENRRAFLEVYKN